MAIQHVVSQILKEHPELSKDETEFFKLANRISPTSWGYINRAVLTAIEVYAIHEEQDAEKDRVIESQQAIIDKQAKQLTAIKDARKLLNSLELGEIE